MENLLTKTECSHLTHVCEIVLEMNPDCANHEDVRMLKEKIDGQENVLLDDHLKRLNLQFGDFQSKSPIFCGITD